MGSYTVTLTAIDTLGSSRVVSHTVTITPLPTSFFSYSTPNCSNEPVNLTDLSYTLYGNIAQWIWNYGDGSPNDTVVFPAEPDQAHLFTGPGTFNVTLTVTNSFGCMATSTIAVDVIEAPIANYQYSSDCSGMVTSFLDASYANGPGNTVQYWWDFGDPATGINNTSDLKDATHMFTAPGTYQVMHIVRNFNNCTDTIVKPVTILLPVAVDFVYDHTCVNGTANFGPDTSVMNVSQIVSWTWEFGDGVTNNLPYTNHVYAAPGSYQVTLKVVDSAGCQASKTRTVVVNPQPVAMFNVSAIPCENAPVLFDDVSNVYAGFITKWNWDFGDGNSQIILFPASGDTEHTYTAPGSYLVKLTITSSDSCTAERIETIVINPAPTANFEVENPCQGMAAQFNDLTQTGGTGTLNGWNWNFRRRRFGRIQYLYPAEPFAYLCRQRQLPGVSHRVNSKRMFFHVCENHYHRRGSFCGFLLRLPLRKYRYIVLACSFRCYGSGGNLELELRRRVYLGSAKSAAYLCHSWKLCGDTHHYQFIRLPEYHLAYDKLFCLPRLQTSAPAARPARSIRLLSPTNHRQRQGTLCDGNTISATEQAPWLITRATRTSRIPIPPTAHSPLP